MLLFALAIQGNARGILMMIIAVIPELLIVVIVVPVFLVLVVSALDRKSVL